MTEAVEAGGDDLVLCHQEPIRTPGAVQPHGALLALAGAELCVRRASASLEPLLGRAPANALGTPFAALFDADAERAVRREIAALDEGALAAPDASDVLPSAPPSGPDAARFRHFELRVGVRGEPHRADAVLHRAGELLLLELDGIRAVSEDAPVSPAPSLGTLQQIGRRLHTARSSEALCAAIVGEVRALTGFDRVMVYRFHDDDHGEVVAESVVADWPPYLGLHYPESDIPAQARELYRRNWIRCIERVPYAPSPILPLDAAPLDLTFSHLRAVSPVHVEYLGNMGVGASMSISLLAGERLWGLIACHHREPRHVPASVRLAGELLGTTFSLLLPATDAAAAADRAARSRENERLLTERMVGAVPFADGRFAHLDLLAELVGADGVAAVSGERVTATGSTPPEGQLLAFVDWLGTARDAPVFASASVRGEVPGAEDWPPLLAGALGIEISRAQRQYLLAFRDERARHVDWAGRPDEKPVVEEGGTRRLAPRHSFARWRESLEGLSPPWEAHELDAAHTLRRTALNLIVGNTEQVLRLNRQLARSHDDMQSFAHIAAHDLKEPLRGINNYAAFLIEDHGEALDEGARARVDSIARLASRGSALTSALLEFAEVGRGAGSPEPFDAAEVVADVFAAVAPELERRGIDWRVHGPLPELRGVRVHFEQAMLNLVGNALKYADPDKAERYVAIDVAPAEGRLAHRVRVRDNGIGIAAEHHRDVFTLFKRLHAPGAYGGGSGLGLAITKRVVELGDGEIVLDSAPGVGTSVTFTYGEPDA